MTRLMYGGRVSLLVGFVVIFIEVFIGIIVGGISGYFGGWVDTALMRFVDLFNAIPFFPMVLIFGSVMDALEVDPMVRIFLLMAILGILGWTGVARIVRGQILSLRELDFMVATEATGIRTSRRIFKHLVPNVMPLLIVQATAGLGGIIITEATLGFLGSWYQVPIGFLGKYYQCGFRSVCYDEFLVYVDTGGHVDSYNRAWLQLCWRRASGCIRPEDEKVEDYDEWRKEFPDGLD